MARVYVPMTSAGSLVVRAAASVTRHVHWSS